MDAEHFEPVQALTPARHSRARTVAATMLPGVLLVAAIGTAILGGGRPEDEPSDAERPVVAPAEPVVDGSLAPDVEGLHAAGFPNRALGLPVHTVARTAALRQAGELRSKVVAVAGWLTVPPEPSCGADAVDTRRDLYGTGSACRRWTLLTDDAEPALAVRGNSVTALRDVGAALWPQGMPGPSLASIAADQVARDRVIQPARAVVLGRFGDPRIDECQRSTITCSTTFAIERVVWVDGDWRLRRPEIYPAEVEPDPSGIVRWPIVDTAIRRGAIVLSEVIAPREDLATIDPTADAATPRDVGTVWYVRALLRPRGLDDPIGDVGWAVIEDDTGEVLASDPEREAADSESPSPDAPPSPSATPVAIPDRMFGMEVLDVAAARELALDEVEPERLVAVEGWLVVAPDEPGCTELPVVACPRTGALAATRDPGGDSIGVETLAGTPLLGLTRQSPSLGTWTVPNHVAVVGRFRSDAAGCRDATRCDPVLTIERLAWLRTAARERPVLTAPGTLVTRWSPESAEKAARDDIDGAGAALLLAFVDRPTLELLDSTAADAAAGAASDGPVWYLRAIAWGPVPDGDDVPTIAWSVVDDRTRRVLASGRWQDPS